MATISVSICCMNNHDTIEPCLRSVAGWADEIVVVDSGSTDGTEQIAQKYADRVVHEPFRGYTQQKQYATSLCRHDWVLVLDSDEEVSPQLRDEIIALDDAKLAANDVLEMPRRNYVMNRYVRAWSPDWQNRLIHQHRAIWDEQVLHDRRMPSHPSRISRLSGPLEHKRHGGTFRDYFNGSLEDSRLIEVARQMHHKGRRCHTRDLLLRPCFAFIKFYLLKGGWMDGKFGLMIGQKAYLGAQLKYAALWAVQNGIEKPAPPVQDNAPSSNSDSN